MIRHYVQGFIKWLLTQEELRWWVNRARKELTDDPVERAHILKGLASMGVNGAVAFVLFSNFVMGPVQTIPYVEHVTDAALPDEGISIPKAPTSPDGRTLCPAGWRSSPGTIPPDAVQQLSQSHAGARSFFVCRKGAFEISIYDNGYVSGYEDTRALTQDQAREALKR